MDDGAVFPDGSTAQSGSPRHPASQLRLSLWGLSGGLIGGVLASAFVIAVTAMIKEILGWLTAQEPWLMFTAPFAGILCAVILLHVVAQGKAVQRVSGNAAPPRRLTAWLRFPASAVRADLTADVVRHAGREESFPW